MSNNSLQDAGSSTDRELGGGLELLQSGGRAIWSIHYHHPHAALGHRLVPITAWGMQMQAIKENLELEYRSSHVTRLIPRVTTNLVI